MPEWAGILVATVVAVVAPMALVQLNHWRRMRQMRRSWIIKREAASVKFEAELAAIRARFNQELH